LQGLGEGDAGGHPGHGDAVPLAGFLPQGEVSGVGAGVTPQQAGLDAPWMALAAFDILKIDIPIPAGIRLGWGEGHKEDAAGLLS